MPLYGTLDITQNAKALPTLANLDTEAWMLPKAEMLQLLIEVPRSTTEGLLPKAMHPALPSYVILAVTKYAESPVGPFNLAMLRLGSRAGAHPRGFLLHHQRIVPRLLGIRAFDQRRLLTELRRILDQSLIQRHLPELIIRHS